MTNKTKRNSLNLYFIEYQLYKIQNGKIKVVNNKKLIEIKSQKIISGKYGKK